ncbi:hypothetical protein ACFRNT_13105 [Streptomyces sp. NPDC056697]|uniref:hypothetical protein n=1 Tax=Streptomyces sp. NPDC056697 TaxID=3345915 RepID=UPI0036813E81
MPTESPTGKAPARSEQADALGNQQASLTDRVVHAWITTSPLAADEPAGGQANVFDGTGPSW